MPSAHFDYIFGRAPIGAQMAKKKERTLWVRSRHLLGEQREKAPVGLFLEAKSSTQGVREASYACDNERLCGRTGREAGTMRQLAKQAVGERAVLSQGRGARMVSDHFLAHCVCSGRREPYGTPFLPPAGGANKGVFI